MDDARLRLRGDDDDDDSIDAKTTVKSEHLCTKKKQKKLTSGNWFGSVSSVRSRQWAKPVTVVHRNGSEYTPRHPPHGRVVKINVSRAKATKRAASVSLTEDA